MINDGGQRDKSYHKPDDLHLHVGNTRSRREDSYEKDARIYEYVKAANPDLPKIGVYSLDPVLHQQGETRIIPFDLSESLGLTEYKATSPNLMASYIRILADEKIESKASATSQAFYVIRGSGSSQFTAVDEMKSLTWGKGDLFVLPAHCENVLHEATSDAAIYWVHDNPLLEYLGVAPKCNKFKPTYFASAKMYAAVEKLKHEPGMEHKNRLGVLLGNKLTDRTETLTLTHTLWSLLNVLGPKQAQPPHKHNSVALDMAVTCAPKGVYTLMGPELGEDGWVKDPIRVEWGAGGVFLTPPGWWHSHHNETDEEAYVLPLQDAGLYTYQQTLDIQFSNAKTWRY